MKDDLEKLVLHQRMELDQVEEIPTEAIWQGVLQQKKKHFQFRILKVTSMAATFLIVAGVMIWFFKNQSPTKLSKDVVITQYLPEWASQKDQYLELIEAKKSDLHFASVSRNAHPEIFSELSELDQFYNASLEDLTVNEDREAILRVLIKYHERQLHLLERLSYEIQKKNEYEKPRQDPVIF